jgi:hypothetical protein
VLERRDELGATAGRVAHMRRTLCITLTAFVAISLGMVAAATAASAQDCDTIHWTNHNGFSAGNPQDGGVQLGGLWLGVSPNHLNFTWIITQGEQVTSVSSRDDTGQDNPPKAYIDAVNRRGDGARADDASGGRTGWEDINITGCRGGASATTAPPTTAAPRPTTTAPRPATTVAPPARATTTTAAPTTVPPTTVAPTTTTAAPTTMTVGTTSSTLSRQVALAAANKRRSEDGRQWVAIAIIVLGVAGAGLLFRRRRTSR